MKTGFLGMVVVVILLSSNSSSIAENKITNLKQNQLYLELFGNGLVYSANYERLLTENFTLRGGFGYTPGFLLVEGTFIQIPVTASYLLGGVTSKFELGLGATFFSGHNVEVLGLNGGDFSLVFLTGILGYRYVSLGGFVFRIAFTPLYNSEADPTLFPSGGLSFGFML